jgi:hypothetical protein
MMAQKALRAYGKGDGEMKPSVKAAKIKSAPEAEITGKARRA